MTFLFNDDYILLRAHTCLMFVLQKFHEHSESSLKHDVCIFKNHVFFLFNSKGLQINIFDIIWN